MHLSSRTTPAGTTGLGAGARSRAAPMLAGCGTYVPDRGWQRASCKKPGHLQAWPPAPSAGVLTEQKN